MTSPASPNEFRGEGEPPSSGRPDFGNGAVRGLPEGSSPVLSTSRQKGGAGRRPSGKPEDVVYTPAWCVADMIEHFAPTGVILDPCRGAGAFYDALPPGSQWCEITEGRDFFDWHDPVDWVIGNPPYSITRPWFRHSYDIAENIVYLVPARNIYSAYGFLDEIDAYGGIVEQRHYGTGGRLGFPMGNAITAFHLRRGHCGAMSVSYYRPEGVEQLDLLDGVA